MTETLRDRKRRQTYDRIVASAFELFGERGFDAVSVDDIARHAEIGRTTFFRYFEDKTEVVFAHRELTRLDETDSPSPASSVPEALAIARSTLSSLCADASTDPEHYAIYFDLVETHTALADRHASKTRHYALNLESRLTAQGASRETAIRVAQLTLGCYYAAWRLAGRDATALRAHAESTFDQMLGRSPG